MPGLKWPWLALTLIQTSWEKKQQPPILEYIQTNSGFPGWILSHLNTNLKFLREKEFDPTWTRLWTLIHSAVVKRMLGRDRLVQSWPPHPYCKGWTWGGGYFQRRGKSSTITYRHICYTCISHCLRRGTFCLLLQVSPHYSILAGKVEQCNLPNSCPPHLPKYGAGIVLEVLKRGKEECQNEKGMSFSLCDWGQWSTFWVNKDLEKSTVAELSQCLRLLLSLLRWVPAAVVLPMVLKTWHYYIISNLFSKVLF